MNARTTLVLVVVALLTLAAAIGAVVAKRADDDDGPAAEVTEVEGGFQGPRSPFKGAVRRPVAAKRFSLRDQDGELVSLQTLRGRVVVLSPMYTTCEDTCPLLAQLIGDALGDLPDSERDQVRALALSVDPGNDTPERAKRFLAERRVRPYLDFLLGSRAELRPIWSAYGFSPQREELEHNAYVVLIDRRGRQRVGFPVQFLTPEALTHDLRLLLSERS